MAGYMPHQSRADDYARGKIHRNERNKSSRRGIAADAVQSRIVSATANRIFMPLAYKYVIQFTMNYLRLVSTYTFGSLPGRQGFFFVADK
jgi:hypothetical protein